MKKLLKQAVGIDVAKNELVVSFGKLFEDWTQEIPVSKTFKNSEKGFEALIKWCSKLWDPAAEFKFVMEATGVYHESLAYYLYDKGLSVTIVLPNKISSYFKTLDVKTVTDNTASQAIVKFALERKLDLWKRPDPRYKQIKQLTREREQIVLERSKAKNQLHAEKAEVEPNLSSVSRMHRRIQLLNEQEKEILEEIKAIVNSDSELRDQISRLSTIPGIGILSASIILSETNGFELIKNKRQIASYAGFDVKEKLSGISVKGKPRISKRGNTYLRKAVFFPAMAAIRSDQGFKDNFSRLVARHGVKLKAAVAVQRKILELCYILHKNKSEYIPDHAKNRQELEKNIIFKKVEHS